MLADVEDGDSVPRTVARAAGVERLLVMASSPRGLSAAPVPLVYWLAASLSLAFANDGVGAEWPYRTLHGPFHIHADYDLTGQPQLVSELERLQSDLLRMLDLGAPREPIDVYLFSSKQQYELYMRTYFPQLTPRRAMFIKTDSPGNVFAYDSDDIEVDLRHECTHALLHAVLPYVPLWFDEGLAEYFEVASDQRVRGNAYLPVVKKHVWWRRPPSLQRLEQLRELERMGAREYREAWAWVHFMLHGPPEAHEQLLAHLSDIRQANVAAPLSARLSTAIGDCDRVFARHFRAY